MMCDGNETVYLKPLKTATGLKKRSNVYVNCSLSARIDVKALNFKPKTADLLEEHVL